MPLRSLTNCSKQELGHKGASLVFLAQHGALVPDAWVWIQPRNVDDIRELSVAGNRIILRGSEPLDCDPQANSGSYPSQVFHLDKLGDGTGPWLNTAYPVIVQHYIEAPLGGAAHVSLTKSNGLLVHLSWSSDVAGVMDGSDSGAEGWLGDLPLFEGSKFPVFIVRSDHLPPELVNDDLTAKLLSQMRNLAKVSRLPFEVEWIVDRMGRLILLQHLHLIDLGDKTETPWVHADASMYVVEK